MYAMIRILFMIIFGADKLPGVYFISMPMGMMSLFMLRKPFSAGCEASVDVFFFFTAMGI